MNRALSSYLLVNHRITTVWLDRIWEAGVPLVELYCARQSLDYRNTAQIQELGHWFRDAPLQLHSLHMPIYNDDCSGRTGPGAVINIADTERIRRRGSIDEVKRAMEIAEYVPCRYAIQHVGVTGEEYDDRKLEAAFSSLEELNVFARQRGVDVLVENTPNGLASAERLLHFFAITHLDNGVCFDTGHAHMKEGVEQAFELLKERIRSTHVHDNDGTTDLHLCPMTGGAGTIDWKKAMNLLQSRPKQYPLLLEVRDGANGDPLGAARQAFDALLGSEAEK